MGAVKLTFLIFVVHFSWQSLGHVPADGKVHATLGPFALQTQPRHHAFASPFLGGAGLIVEGDIDYNGGIEIALFYLQQLYSIERENLVVTEKSQRMNVTMGYRHWFTHHVSGAVAFFSSYSMGEGHIVRNDFGSVAPPKTSAHDMTEYGFDFSIQIEPWRKDRFSFIIDARYSQCVTQKEGEDENYFGVLAGIKYFVQSRDEVL